MWWIIMSVLLVLAIAVYLMFPNTKMRARFLSGLYFAHRGLHNDEIKENTMPAFLNAAEKGFAIELDVRLSADNKAVVAHDGDLSRVFGIDKKVSDFTADELNKIGVPTFEQVLNEINGKTLILVEIKDEPSGAQVCVKAAEALDSYKGEYAVQSFNSNYIRWFKKNRPDMVRGQLLSHISNKGFFVKFGTNIIRHFFIFNALGRPDFISYNCKWKKDFCPGYYRFFGVPVLCWTVRSDEQEKEIKEFFDGYIFEGYLPKNR